MDLYPAMKQTIFRFLTSDAHKITVDEICQHALTLFSQWPVVSGFQFHHKLSKRVGNPGSEYGQDQDAQTDGPAFRVFSYCYP